MLIIVDMQNDYVDRDGRAAIKGAKELENGILDRIKKTEENGGLILYTINTMVSYEDRNKPEIEWAIRPYGKLEKALKKHHIIKKTNYAISAEQAIKIKNNIIKNSEVESIEFVGVETNICVLANGLVFQNLFPNSKIVINSKLCTSSNDILHSKALDIMDELKMEVI